MSRGIDEQKEEIRVLEERIEKQRRVIMEALVVVRREIGKAELSASGNGSMEVE